MAKKLMKKNNNDTFLKNKFTVKNKNLYLLVSAVINIRMGDTHLYQSNNFGGATQSIEPTLKNDINQASLINIRKGSHN